jgi:hypothetical protein
MGRDDNASHGKMQDTWRGRLEREVEKTAKMGGPAGRTGGEATRKAMIARDLRNHKGKK